MPCVPYVFFAPPLVKLEQHRSALRGTSRGGFAGVPYALNLELYFSVFLKPISLSLRGVGVLCYTAVSRNLSPPFPLLHCAWLVVRVRVLWACCARARAVGVLCCTAVRARAPPFFSTALGLLCAQSEPEPKAPFSTALDLLCARAGCGRVVLRAV